MSAPCDPLFEVCEDETLPEQVVEEEVEEEAAGSLKDLIMNATFGLGLLYGAFSGFSSFGWLKSEIEGDSTRYPARVDGTDAFDMEWAVETEEVRAWDSAGSFVMWSYAASLLVWGLNFGMGNNGGSLHRVFYRASHLFPLVTLGSLYKVYRIEAAYLMNDWFRYYKNMGVDNGGSVARSEFMYLLDPTEDDDTSPHYYNPTEHNDKIWGAVLTQLLIGVVAFYAQSTFEAQWTEGLAIAEAEAEAAEEETEGQEEEAAE